jgi:hypothetical protein
MLLWSILATIPGLFIPFVILGAWIFQIWSTYRMGKALNLPNTWLWVVGTMIPLVGLIVLLIMNGKATEKLRKAGIPVGLMGAKMSALTD